MRTFCCLFPRTLSVVLVGATVAVTVASCGGSDANGPTGPDLIQVQISPQTDTTLNHAIGDTIQFSASVTDLSQNKDMTGTMPVTWSSLDTAVIINSSGSVIVRSGGTARIVATAGAVADTATLRLKISLPSLRLVSINGVPLSATGPNAVTDSFNVSIEVRNPPDGYVLNALSLVVNTPDGPTIAGPITAPNIQPGETRTLVVRDMYTPPGTYDAYARVTAGTFEIAAPHIPLVVSNDDVTPPQLQGLTPSQDTTWKAGTPLRIVFNLVDLESGVQGYTVKTTWAVAPAPGCVDNETGGVDTYIRVMGIPVTLSFSGCTVPVGVNTIVITGIDRAGNKTVKTLKITGS